MMGITFGVLSPWLDHDFCRRLTLCVAHFVWQGSALALAYALVAACLRRGAANTRYMVAGLTLALMAACLPATFFSLSTSAGDRSDRLHELTKVAASVPSGIVAMASVGDPGVTATRLPTSSDVAGADQQAVWKIALDNGRRILLSLAPWVSTLYFFGVLIMLLRLSAGI